MRCVTGRRAGWSCAAGRVARLRYFVRCRRHCGRHYGGLTTPTQIVYGDRTYPFVGRAVRRLAASNRHVTAHQTAGGHCFMLEHPASAAAAVRAQLLGV